MKLTCKECGQSFSSLIIDAPQAAMEIGQKFLEHLIKRHHDKTVEKMSIAQMLGTVVNWIVMIKELGQGFDERLIAQMKVQEEVVLEKLRISIDKPTESEVTLP